MTRPALLAVLALALVLPGCMQSARLGTGAPGAVCEVVPLGFWSEPGLFEALGDAAGPGDPPSGLPIHAELLERGWERYALVEVAVQGSRTLEGIRVMAAEDGYGVEVRVPEKVPEEARFAALVTHLERVGVPAGSAARAIAERLALEEVETFGSGRYLRYRGTFQGPIDVTAAYERVAAATPSHQDARPGTGHVSLTWRTTAPDGTGLDYSFSFRSPTRSLDLAWREGTLRLEVDANDGVRATAIRSPAAAPGERALPALNWTAVQADLGAAFAQRGLPAPTFTAWVGEGGGTCLA